MSSLYVFVISLLFISLSAKAQQTGQDSIITLESVIIKSYENNHRLIDVPAAISIVSAADLKRYDNISIIEAMNSKPGVRMEERSPGSYRLSIRGSSIRAPFGIRNVKVYYNGIPFTDPGGNTYLNQLGFSNYNSIEIIKGPAGSIYGAGTGGVLLIKNNNDLSGERASVSYNTGSYMLQNMNLHAQFGKEGLTNTINYQHQESDGYRDHTALRRDVFTWDATLKSNDKTILQSHFLYGDMYYQTPGALTKAEFDLNPRSARPKAGKFPSASEARAAFYAKTVLAGFSLEQKISEQWKNTTSLYGAYSQNRNPNFRNYSRTSEPHFGGRTNFQFIKNVAAGLFTINTGIEFQQSLNTLRIYNNNKGNPENLQTDDEIYNSQGFIFIQGNLSLSSGWDFTLGASLNEFNLHFNRLSSTPVQVESRRFNNQIAPRLAVLKKLNKSVSVYGNIARGFSPPATAEVLPSTNIFNTDLQAESGLNEEFGVKAYFLKNKLYVDVNAFFYQLKNAIVQKRDASGGDYFDNAGSANQNGLESYFSYQIINQPLRFVNYSKVFISHTWNHFRYKEYIQSGKDYSGNAMPGVAAQTISSGLDISTKPGIYANISYFYGGRIALNDLNDSYATPYNLLGIKIGYNIHLKKKSQLQIFAGGQNILNENYSLGNDINAAGGRYYNAAPGINFYGGLSLAFSK
ncbi:MAG: TonB-dependent receptor plug domain-containing protein [Ginsengibacter sp.]